MNNIILRRSKKNIAAAAFCLACAILLIYLWATNPHDKWFKYWMIGTWSVFGFLYIRKLVFYPPLAVKNDILYISPDTIWKPKKVPLAEIDHIEHRRFIFINVIGKKSYTETITVINKSGKEILAYREDISEKRFSEIDNFLKNAFDGIQVIEGT